MMDMDAETIVIITVCVEMGKTNTIIRKMITPTTNTVRTKGVIMVTLTNL